MNDRKIIRFISFDELPKDVMLEIYLNSSYSDLQNIFTLNNQPIIQRTQTEKLTSNH